jgi:hypothetical protein
MNSPTQQRPRQPPPRPQNNAAPASSNGANGASQEADSDGQAKTRKAPVRRSLAEREAESARKVEKQQKEIAKEQRKLDDLKRQGRLKTLADTLSKSEDKDLKKQVRRAIECERDRGVLLDAQEVLEEMNLSTDSVVAGLETLSKESADHMAALEAAVA